VLPLLRPTEESLHRVEKVAGRVRRLSPERTIAPSTW
jgi:hypothetical protein